MNIISTVTYDNSNTNETLLLRFSHYNIFPIEEKKRKRKKIPRGPKKKKKGEKTSNIVDEPSESFASRQIDDNIVQVVTNSRPPIRPPLYPGEKSAGGGGGGSKTWAPTVVGSDTRT